MPGAILTVVIGGLAVWGALAAGPAVGLALGAITIDTSVARTLWRKAEHLLRSPEDPRLDWVTASHVRVPPSYIGAARTAADRIHTRWLA